MGVVVRRYIDILIIIITFPYSIFFLAASFLLLFIFKMFFHSCLLFLCNIANVVQRTFEIIQKSRSREHGDIIISTRTYVDCTHARVPRLPRARYRMNNCVVEVSLLHVW